MRKINEIIIHCSATSSEADIGVAEIRQFHVQKRGWKDIGYHYVIRRSGLIEVGRKHHEIGAHCKNRNRYSIGICLVGGIDGMNNFHVKQLNSCHKLIAFLKLMFPDIEVSPHNKYANRYCPSFDINSVL